jgi:hypothetical protein
MIRTSTAGWLAVRWLPERNMNLMLLLAAALAQAPLDFTTYRNQVEPVFLKLRDGGRGSCYSCHSRIKTRFRLQPLPHGTESFSEEASRRNFDVVSGLVAPGAPLESRLLLHPLAEEAGGDSVHTGGKFWASQDDPEWRALAAWVRTGSAVEAPAKTIELDFDVYRANVEPLFLKKRAGHARCYVCHKRTSNFRLEVLAEGATTFTEEQSRTNFEATKRIVAPGKPLESRLVTIALAEEAGGDPFHPGGKHFESQDDPEWKALADWVRGR